MGDIQKEGRRVDPLKSREIITVKALCDRKVGDEEVQSMLADFQSLDFENNPCNNPSDVINYNDGQEADPFHKICRYYGREKNIFFFISMLQDEKQLRKIEEIIDGKCDDVAKANFLRRLNIYLDRIKMGRDDAKECLKTDDFPNAFTHGCYRGGKRNVHENFHINFTVPEQSFEASTIFNTRVKRMDEEDSEVRKIKVYSNGQRIATVFKNGNLQRSYSFNKDCFCHLFVSWKAQDELGNERNCSISLDINGGKIGSLEFKIDGRQDELKEDLVKQNDVVIVKGRFLHEILQ